MNAYVHDTLTRTWAGEVGFSPDDAAAIARADVGVDRIYDGHLWRNKRYHFGLLGARRWSRRWFKAAVERRDLNLLGQAIHCEQDAISHGLLGHVWHYPGIDLWEHRSARVHDRLERATKELLREYLDLTL